MGVKSNKGQPKFLSATAQYLRIMTLENAALETPTSSKHLAIENITIKF